jgi:hypothetical protein
MKAERTKIRQFMIIQFMNHPSHDVLSASLNYIEKEDYKY